MTEQELQDKAKKLGELMLGEQLRLVTAESCTGGLVTKIITDIPGSSAWFDSGIISYSNGAKTRLLGVPEDLVAEFGSVSEATVLTMLSGILLNPGLDIGVAVSGIAGPDGGTADKPVGTVWIAWARHSCQPTTEQYLFEGDREQVRMQATNAALQGLIEQVERATDSD